MALSGIQLYTLDQLPEDAPPSVSRALQTQAQLTLPSNEGAWVTLPGTPAVAIHVPGSLDRSYLDWLEFFAQWARQSTGLAAPSNPLAQPSPLEKEPHSALENYDFLRKMDRISHSDSTVVLWEPSGDPGAPQAMNSIVRHIHNNSARRNGPIQWIDCKSLSSDLLELQLFGRNQPGWLDRTRGGVLVFQQIESLQSELQAKLLRLLQDRTYFRMGGTRMHRLHTRVIATTQADLAHEAEWGRMRKDLYHFLNPFIVKLPKNPTLRVTQATHDQPGLKTQLPRTSTLEEIERRHILKTLDLMGGNKTRSAEVLGITLKTLYNKLQRYQDSIAR